MATADHMITIGVVLALASISASFRIRRSGVAGYDDPYGLTNAFADMERPRRADYRNLLRSSVLEDDEPYFNPNTLPLDYIGKSPFINEEEPYGYLPEYIYDKSYKRSGPIDEYPFPNLQLDDHIYGPQKRTPQSSHRVVPTMEELRTIFGEADVPMKRVAPVKRQEPKQVMLIEPDSYDEDEDERGTETRAEAVRKLLNAAEQLSENEPQEDEEVSEDIEGENGEIIDILTDAKTYDDGETESETKIEADRNGDIVKEETNEVVSQAQSKSKRASNGVSSDYVLALLKQVSELKKKVSELELIQMLEGKENDYLANALKYATLDQLEEQDVFIEKEYDDIAKATETESLIQELIDDAEDEEDDTDDGFADDVEEDMPLLDAEPAVVKKEDASRPDPRNSETWYDNPVQEDVGTGALLEEGEDDATYPVDLPLLEAAGDEDDMEDEDDIAEENEYQPEDEEKHVLLDLLSSLSPSTVESIIADLQANEEMEGQEMCPPVLELSDNCAFADAGGFPVDEDARQLCVRHQICYSCGSAVGIVKKGCDEGYKGDVIEECDGNSDCLKDAAIFLRLMNRAHVYEPVSPPECNNPCVQDFILGVAK